MTFDNLRLAAPLLRAVADDGYSSPTPIQIKAIPPVLDGRDLLGCAQTGSGKTAAFALPILQRLSADAARPRGHHPIRALVLCPTRELAAQIGESFRAYGRHLHLRTAVIFGGVSQHHQVRSLKAGVDILIATPGRLMDLMEQRHVDLRAVQTLVLDEADRMLDMGFIHDIRRIVAKVPTKRQTLMFSATMPPDIRRLAGSILRDPVSVEANPVASMVKTISQWVYHVPQAKKPALLLHLLKSDGMQRTLVFTRTKHGADRVVRDLTRGGVRAEAIHGNKSQNNRTRALAAFKSDAPPVLVATDIASRGIDVDDITHVINFDIPNVPESYVHRIGRTARAGASGTAVSLCDPRERGDLIAIERLTRTTIRVRKDLPELVIEESPPHEREERPAHPRARERSRSSSRGRSNHRAAATAAPHHAGARGFLQRGRGPGRGARRIGGRSR